MSCLASQWHKIRVTTAIRKAESQDGLRYMTCGIHIDILQRAYGSVCMASHKMDADDKAAGECQCPLIYIY